MYQISSHQGVGLPRMCHVPCAKTIFCCHWKTFEKCEIISNFFLRKSHSQVGLGIPPSSCNVWQDLRLDMEGQPVNKFAC